MVFWSDTNSDKIYRSDFYGNQVEELVNSSILVVGMSKYSKNVCITGKRLHISWSKKWIILLYSEDIAVEWVSNKLYWVDAEWARIEVLDLDSLLRAEVLRVGPNTLPRGIAVDPISR